MAVARELPMRSQVGSVQPEALRRGWSPRRIIALLGGGLIVIAIILFGALSHVRWRATVNEAEQLAANLADMLAEHAGRVFDAANLVAMQAIQTA